MELAIQSMRAEDAIHRHDLLRQAFGATRPFDPDAPAARPDQVVGAYQGARLVGTLVTFDFAQTWGGRAVPCGGVSGVAVAPEARGRGVAREMVAEALHRMVRRGLVVAALYPTASALYRAAGFEVVASFRRRVVPLGEVDVTAEALAWRPTGLDDPAKAGLHDRAAALHDGWFRGDPGWWARRDHDAAADTSVNRWCYVGARDGEDVAVVQYRYDTSETAMFDLDVEVIAGLDGRAVGAALALLAGHGSTAGTIRTALPASLLGDHVPELQRTKALAEWPLMLRVVDAPAAVRARGWPRAVRGRIELHLVDDLLPANAGPQVLEVADGRAELVPGGGGRVTMSAMDLAVVYAGGDVWARRGAGGLAGATDEDLELLAAAFVSHPTSPLFF